MNPRNHWLPMLAVHLAAMQQWLEVRTKVPFLTVILIALNLAITMPLAGTLNIWIDEAYSLNTSGGGVSYAIHQAIFFEEQAPLYFLILTLWRHLNDSIFFARLFSILCIVLTLYFVSLLAQKLFGASVSGWLTAAIAVNPFILWAAVEIRLYAFSILLSTLLLWLFFEAYVRDPPTRLVRWVYILVAVISLYTHYFLAFLLMASVIVLLASGKKRALLHYLSDLSLVGILFLPLVWQLCRQLSVVPEQKELLELGADETVFTTSLKGLKTVFAVVASYLLPVSRSLNTDVATKALLSVMQTLRFAVLALVTFLLFKQRRRLKLKVSPLPLLTAILFILLIATYSLVDGVHPRHLTILLIPLLFSVFSVLIAVQSATRKAVIRSWFVTLLVFSLVACGIMYTPLAKDGDYLRVAAYITAHEKPHQTILVFNPEVGMVLGHYYTGAQKIVAVPKAIDYRHFTWKSFVLTDEQDITNALTQPLHERHALWLVTNAKQLQEQTLYRQSVQLLDQFIARHYVVSVTKTFYGSTVQLLQQK